MAYRLMSLTCIWQPLRSSRSICGIALTSVLSAMSVTRLLLLRHSSCRAVRRASSQAAVSVRDWHCEISNRRSAGRDAMAAHAERCTCTCRMD